MLFLFENNFIKMLKFIGQCIVAPRLYKAYHRADHQSFYQRNCLEKWSDRVIYSANFLFNFSLYTSPFLFMYLYKRDFFTVHETWTIYYLFGGLGCFMALSYILRGLGRACNNQYVQFLKDLTVKLNDKKAYIDGIRKYDFDFYAWPVSYKDKQTPTPKSSWLSKHPFSACANNDLPFSLRITIQILAYIAIHTFGLKILYPGSMTVMNLMLWYYLVNGRTQLVEENRGMRAKLETADGNYVDTMFVDLRSREANGRTLVICCEGNAGFYEVGTMTVPIKAGYSTLGWNHPGFGGSTGHPYLENEVYSIDVVLQYAINELNFRPDEIVLLGWSIGGYTATWAAVNYAVKGLILDATFDDLLPLALSQMPKSWSLLVKEVVRSYVDLNVSEQLLQYDGPVQIIRRSEDEMICLKYGQLESNRGNHLLAKLLEHRHPELVSTATAKDALDKLLAMHEIERDALNPDDIGEEEKALLPVISQYMSDFKGTHCAPLSVSFFTTLMENIHEKKS